MTCLNVTLMRHERTRSPSPSPSHRRFAGASGVDVEIGFLTPRDASRPPGTLAPRSWSRPSPSGQSAVWVQLSFLPRHVNDNGSNHFGGNGGAPFNGFSERRQSFHAPDATAAASQRDQRALTHRLQGRGYRRTHQQEGNRALASVERHRQSSCNRTEHSGCRRRPHSSFRASSTRELGLRRSPESPATSARRPCECLSPLRAAG